MVENNMRESGNSSNSDADTDVWQNEIVTTYDYRQSLVSEKKEEVLINICRVVNYFCEIQQIDRPRILDIGCGPGTPATLSAYVLNRVPGSIVFGVDSSQQMIQVAKHNLLHSYRERFDCAVSDFNRENFWIPEINHTYDFAVSCAALHYLTDERRISFLREVYDHLTQRGVFIASVANHSSVTEIAEMAHTFRVQFTYNRLQNEGRAPAKFEEFQRRFEEEDRRFGINWTSTDIFLKAMKAAGFREVDIVWHLWVRSIFISLK